MERIKVAIAAALKTYTWLPELLGILPLSALLEFIDTHRKLHVSQLVGAVPLWSWPITPSGSRILLSPHSDWDSLRPCHMDSFEVGMHSVALDGRWGDKYFISNPETLRLCLQATSNPIFIPNYHKNMMSEGENARIQHLEIICVSNIPPYDTRTTSSSRLPSLLVDPWRRYSLRYVVVSAVGWMLLFLCVVAAALMSCWVALAFLLVISITGPCVLFLHGSRPRSLLRSEKLSYDRIITVTEHENSSNWKVFCGPSTTLGSLLSLPLKDNNPPIGPRLRWWALIGLRFLIASQWATVLAAATLKDWSAFIISFWITFCIFSHAYLISPSEGAKFWMEKHAGITFRRYHTRLSSRRSLLNTIMALNPDTIPWSEDTRRLTKPNFQWHKGAVVWIDPILKQSPNKERWMAASIDALNETTKKLQLRTLASDQRAKDDNNFGLEWHLKYDLESDWWLRFIREGVYLAAKIKVVTNLNREQAEA